MLFFGFQLCASCRVYIPVTLGGFLISCCNFISLNPSLDRLAQLRRTSYLPISRPLPLTSRMPTSLSTPIHFARVLFFTIFLPSCRTGDDFSFDEKMADYGCTVFAFDPSTGKEDHNHSERVMFYNLGLSDVNQERTENVSDQLDKSAWKTRTLATIVKELGHSKVIRQ